MRILLLHNRYRQQGGEDASVAAHLQLLKERGHDVSLIEANNTEIDGTAATARAAAGWVYSRKWRAKVATEIAAFRPDVAHVHNVFPLLSPSVIYACNAARIPVIQTLHNYRLLCPIGILFRAGKVCEACVGTSFPWAGVLHRCYHQSALGTAVVGTGTSIHRLLATYSRRVDRFIVLTEFAKAKFVSAHLPVVKFEVIPNWLASDPGPGAGNGGFFLFVGRLSPEKGVAELLLAWSRIRTPARLKIVGAGPLESEVAVAAKRGCGLEYVGHLTSPDVTKLMQQATALIVPSQWYEGLPMTVIEAYASGTPVIASRLGSLEELVVPKRTGLLFAPQDPEDLAQKIDWISTNPGELPSMRSAARAAFEANYNAACGYRRLMGVYRRAARTVNANEICEGEAWN